MSEESLLQAVRDTIRTQCSYKDSQCDVEIEEMAPSGAGEVYCAVQPNGVTSGPNNQIGGGVLDELFAVKVTVILRTPNAQRDKTRRLMLDYLKGLNTRLRQIKDCIHFSYPVMNAANLLIYPVDAGIAPQQQLGFIEPLVYNNIDTRPQVAGGEFFADITDETRAGVKRSIYFVKARRIQYQTAMQ